MKAEAIASNGSKRGAHEVQKLLADVEELLKRISEIDDADVASLRRRVKDSVAMARDAFESSARQIRQRAGAAAEAADEYAHDRPWTLVGVSIAAGVVLGALLMRR